ncbi:MAG: 4'-phosphopantetheinyl transferase superfamily protein [Cyanobacteria bacterium P01_H01_bin.121]
MPMLPPEHPAPITWLAPTLPLSQPVHQTHVWWLKLAELSDPMDLRPLLSVLEQARADRYATAQLQWHFTTIRAGLRVLLGHYCQCAPRSVEFAYLANGKPVLAAASQSAKSLHFNLSHSGDYAIYTIAPHPIGIDLEVIRPLPNALALAERFFHPAEAAVLRSLPRSEQALGFLRYWVCKEAYVKATGQGLAHELNQVLIDWPVSPLNSATISQDSAQDSRYLPPNVKLTPNAKAASQPKLTLQLTWSLQELTPAQGLVGAIASTKQPAHDADELDLQTYSLHPLLESLSVNPD